MGGLKETQDHVSREDTLHSSPGRHSQAQLVPTVPLSGGMSGPVHGQSLAALCCPTCLQGARPWHLMAFP